MAKKKSEAEAKEKPAELDIDQDMTFQRRQWVVQRIGWLIFGLIVLGGLVGVLGAGPLSNVKASGADGAQVEYERFTHRATPMTLTIDPGASVSADGTVEIALPYEFISNLEIHRIVPEPDSEILSGDEIIYSFNVGEGGLSPITFHVEAEDAGSFQAHIRINDGDPITFNQMVYP
jgi:hypothetical protein